MNHAGETASDRSNRSTASRSDPASWPARTPQTAASTLATGLLTGLFMTMLVMASMKLCNGQLMYTLDDPYIHLALARNIQGGSYGINPGEWASPSSSILWPFLLALVPANFSEWGPLAINAVCCVLTACQIEVKLQETILPAWARSTMAFLLAFGMNVIGLVMTGMEHSLQILLVVSTAVHMSRGRFTTLTYLMLGVMPLVRYECLALSYPLLGYLAVKDSRAKAMMTAALLTTTVVGFSWVLHSKGLPWLPCSVLAKTDDGFRLFGNWKGQPALIALAAWLIYHYQKQRLELVLLIMLPTLFYFLAGKSGWFGRYETFIVAYLVIFTLHTLRPDASDRRSTALGNSPLWVSFIGLAVAFSFPNLAECTARTPLASKNIWQQQRVMANIAKELGEPVAVTDLGLVALRSGQHVLDLWGLGSYEALQARRASDTASPIWVEHVMTRHDVRYAFVYEKWFANTPDNWIKVGELILPGKKITPAEDRVALFATSATSAEKLRLTLARYQKTGDQGDLIKPNKTPAPDTPPVTTTAESHLAL